MEEKKTVKIYTRSGDAGMTSTVGGVRVRKSDSRIEVYGTLDELNACIGYLLAQDVPESDVWLLNEAQSLLFELGGALFADGKSILECAHFEKGVLNLERAIDLIQQEVPRPGGFVLPGGTSSAAWGHVTRTVCRRAERLLCDLLHDGHVAPTCYSYINRLSDYLFALSLKLNYLAAKKENLWQKRCGFEK